MGVLKELKLFIKFISNHSFCKCACILVWTVFVSVKERGHQNVFKICSFMLIEINHWCKWKNGHENKSLIKNAWKTDESHAERDWEKKSNIIAILHCLFDGEIWMFVLAPIHSHIAYFMLLHSHRQMLSINRANEQINKKLIIPKVYQYKYALNA